MPELLRIEELHLHVTAPQRPVQQVLGGVSLRLAAGETVGLAGESGSGKSMLALAAMGLLPPAAQVARGRIVLGGQDLLALRPGDWRQWRGRKLAMVFQNPAQALNPIRRIGEQLADVLRLRAPALTRRQRHGRSLELLEQVGLHPAPQRLAAYPFQLSGGQCQRVMIALALAGKPELLIADEPTTGLDVTTQAAIMDLIGELARQHGMATLLISHDLALLAQRCQRVAILHQGRVVEEVMAEHLAQAKHPYSRRLVAATPRLGQGAQAQPASPGAGRAVAEPPLLRVEGLRKRYALPAQGWWTRRQGLRAVDGVDLDIGHAEAVGLVGESGSGKSTLSAILARLADADAGRIVFDGLDIAATPARQAASAPWRGGIQMVFQDPVASFNPTSSVAEIVGAPLRHLRGMHHAGERLQRVRAALAQAGLAGDEFLARRPHQLSGGQAARVGIARAIAVQPRLLILDEPTAALDVSVQAGVLALLRRLQRQQGLSYLFVSHNLQVVQALCQRVLVMQHGRIVDAGETQQLLGRPSHPYTQALVEAVPRW